MKKLIGKVAITLMGWTFRIDIDKKYLKKAVMVCAPHTSNSDFFYAIFGFWAIGVPIKLIIKDSHTKAWYGFIVKALGGIGINRKQASNIVDTCVDLFNTSENMVLIITPEGTRSFSPKWKKGFYYIAKKAQIPILLGIGNYKEKEAQVVDVINPQEKTLEETFEIIEKTYKPEQARYPEKYNPKVY